MLSLPSTLPTLDDKNVVPLVSPDTESLYLVYSFVPYGLCQLDVGTGRCTQVQLDADGALGGPEDLVSCVLRSPGAPDHTPRGSRLV
jgi:hypothetical protein